MWLEFAGTAGSGAVGRRGLDVVVSGGLDVVVGGGLDVVVGGGLDGRALRCFYSEIAQILA